MLGIWSNYEVLEESLSMPELFLTLEAINDAKHEDRKFAASLKGINLDEDNGENKWEEIKARAFSGGRTNDPNDILSYTGRRAAEKGFGIGHGLTYVDANDTDTVWWG